MKWNWSFAWLAAGVSLVGAVLLTLLLPSLSTSLTAGGEAGAPTPRTLGALAMLWTSGASTLCVAVGIMATPEDAGLPRLRWACRSAVAEGVLALLHLAMLAALVAGDYRPERDGGVPQRHSEEKVAVATTGGCMAFALFLQLVVMERKFSVMQEEPGTVRIEPNLLGSGGINSLGDTDVQRGETVVRSLAAIVSRYFPMRAFVAAISMLALLLNALHSSPHNGVRIVLVADLCMHGLMVVFALYVTHAFLRWNNTYTGAPDTGLGMGPEKPSLGMCLLAYPWFHCADLALTIAVFLVALATDAGRHSEHEYQHLVRRLMVLQVVLSIALNSIIAAVCMGDEDGVQFSQRLMFVYTCVQGEPRGAELNVSSPVCLPCRAFTFMPTTHFAIMSIPISIGLIVALDVIPHARERECGVGVWLLASQFLVGVAAVFCTTLGYVFESIKSRRLKVFSGISITFTVLVCIFQLSVPFLLNRYGEACRESGVGISVLDMNATSAFFFWVVFYIYAIALFEQDVEAELWVTVGLRRSYITNSNMGTAFEGLSEPFSALLFGSLFLVPFDVLAWIYAGHESKTDGSPWYAATVITSVAVAMTYLAAGLVYRLSNPVVLRATGTESGYYYLGDLVLHLSLVVYLVVAIGTLVVASDPIRPKGWVKVFIVTHSIRLLGIVVSVGAEVMGYTDRHIQMSESVTAYTLSLTNPDTDHSSSHSAGHLGTRAPQNAGVNPTGGIALVPGAESGMSLGADFDDPFGMFAGHGFDSPLPRSADNGNAGGVVRARILRQVRKTGGVWIRKQVSDDQIVWECKETNEGKPAPKTDLPPWLTKRLNDMAFAEAIATAAAARNGASVLDLDSSPPQPPPQTEPAISSRRSRSVTDDTATMLDTLPHESKEETTLQEYKQEGGGATSSSSAGAAAPASVADSVPSPPPLPGTPLGPPIPSDSTADKSSVGAPAAPQEKADEEDGLEGPVKSGGFDGPDDRPRSEGSGGSLPDAIPLQHMPSATFLRRVEDGAQQVEWVDGARLADETISFAQDPSVRVLRDVTSAELAAVAGLSFQEKCQWFREQLARIRIPWESGHQVVEISRDNLVEDSIRAVESLSPTEMRQIFRFTFTGEQGLDAGGVAREWVSCLTREMFDVQYGLFKFASTDNITYQLNPQARERYPDKYRSMYNFLGRFLAKAVFDNIVVPAHLVRPLYKHLLGLPVNFHDLQFVDQSLYDSLCWMMEQDNVDILSLTFTIMEVHADSSVEEVDLVENGAEVCVTDKNKKRYLELNFRRRMLDSVSDLLAEFLRGFYHVIPSGLLSVFDFQELELLMCGLENIDVDDWRENTVYEGSYNRSHRVVNWFWAILQDFSQEQRARLLQFVTGTSRVPVGGFKNLQGVDGATKLFTIRSLELTDFAFPAAHTCFNRLELPIATSKESLQQALTHMLQLEITGFSLE